MSTALIGTWTTLRYNVLRRILRMFQKAKTLCQGIKQQHEYNMFCPHHLDDNLAICILDIMIVVATLTLQKALAQPRNGGISFARWQTSNFLILRRTGR